MNILSLSRKRSILIFIFLFAASPVMLATLVLAYLRMFYSFGFKSTPKTYKGCVLVSGGKMTKALALTRHFSKTGYKVILVESRKYVFCAHRFSNSVHAFHTVPDPIKQTRAYELAMLSLIKEYGVNIYVPVASPFSSLVDAQIKKSLEKYCKVLHFDEDVVRMLDDKYSFCVAAKKAGLSAPEVHHITDKNQLRDFDFGASGKSFVLKSLCYDSISRLKMPILPTSDMENLFHQLNISADRPWILQEYIKGQELCTHSVVREGRVVLHTTCSSSAFQVNYKHVDHERIENWVRSFAKFYLRDGQISFDFMQASDGEIYPIECNPRTHSAVTVFRNQPCLTSSYLEDSPDNIVYPMRGERPTHWLGHEVWRLTSAKSRQLRSRLWKRLRSGEDAVFEWTDPLPFVALYYLHIPRLLWQNFRQNKPWLRIDFNIGKLVEEGGD